MGCLNIYDQLILFQTVQTIANPSLVGILVLEQTMRCQRTEIKHGLYRANEISTKSDKLIVLQNKRLNL